MAPKWKGKIGLLSDNFQIPAKKAWILRDMRKRYAASDAEPVRQSLKYIVHNLQYSPQVRAQAALDLTRMNGDTRICRIRNRCVMTGRGRSVLRDFKMNRIPFRDFAKAGWIPGVQKASW